MNVTITFTESEARAAEAALDEYRVLNKLTGRADDTAVSARVRFTAALLDAARCPSLHRGVRCDLDVGHDGYHGNEDAPDVGRWEAT